MLTLAQLSNQINELCALSATSYCASPLFNRRFTGGMGKRRGRGGEEGGRNDRELIATSIWAAFKLSMTNHTFHPSKAISTTVNQSRLFQIHKQFLKLRVVLFRSALFNIFMSTTFICKSAQPFLLDRNVRMLYYASEMA